MKKILLLIILLFTLSVSALAQAQYQITIQENGDALFEILTSKQVRVPIPNDVFTPQVQDGSYVIEGSTLQIMPDLGKNARVSFTSSLPIVRDEGIFEATFHITSATSLDIVLPQDVRVISASPKPMITKDETLQLHYENLEEPTIRFSYVSLTNTFESTRNTTFWYVLAGIFLGLILTVLLLVGYKKRQTPIVPQNPSTENTSEKSNEQQPTLPKMSEGQLNIIRAVNPNEALIIRTILKNNNHIKRNQLEKETNLAKSSLASSLKNLEKKNILHVDRSFHVHYITFTDWFKDL